MLSKLTYVFLLLGCMLSFSQQLIKGKINNTDDVEGIHVYNQTFSKYTITNKNGEFEIQAKLNDEIFFSALKYKLTSIFITEETLQKGISITLENQVNELDEVYIGYKLTGNLAVDAKNIKTEPYVDYNAQFKGIDLFKELPRDEYSEVKNEVMSELGGGVNLMPIVKGVFKMIAGDKKEKSRAFVPKHHLTLTYLKHHFGVQFLIKDLQLKEDDLERFVQFCQYDQMAKSYVLSDNKFRLVERLLALRKEFK